MGSALGEMGIYTYDMENKKKLELHDAYLGVLGEHACVGVHLLQHLVDVDGLGVLARAGVHNCQGLGGVSGCTCLSTGVRRGELQKEGGNKVYYIY